MRNAVSMVMFASGLVAGCTDVSMQEAAWIPAAKPKVALVNFVRAAVVSGDGMQVDIWDGDTYVGALGAGKMIQYETTPGKHLFMAKAENWSYALAELQDGKQYLVRATLVKGLMRARVVLATEKPDGPDVEWQKLKPTIASEQTRKEMADEHADKVRAAIAEFESGRVKTFATVGLRDGV